MKNEHFIFLLKRFIKNRNFKGLKNSAKFNDNDNKNVV